MSRSSGGSEISVTLLAGAGCEALLVHELRLEGSDWGTF